MQLTKHHGLGNDFLVLLGDADVVAPADAALARRVCDRHRGIGADGLMVGLLPSGTPGPGPDGADVTLTLYNADGSRAELSGNGIRCLAQAVVRQREASGVGPTDAVVVATDAGLRRCEVTPGPTADTVEVTVDMGKATAGPAVVDPNVAATPALVGTADLGNPHLVLVVDDPATVDVAAAGPRYEAGYPGGINVHFVAPATTEPDTLDMVIWERGAGVTEACGTGACAAAWTARNLGLMGNDVTVRMPGGAVAVHLDGDAVTLRGPATFIAEVRLDA